MAKRLFDLFFSILGLLILTPFLLIVGIAVKLSSPGPVFFRSQRVGKNGKMFYMLKFRTMTKDAPLRGPVITFGKDPRITKVGAFLRRLKIDELPQLINVLKGEMSLVGPRPEVPEYVRLYTPEQKAVLNLTPGITDPASIKYAQENEILGASPNPEETYLQQVMPEKIRLNLEYARQANLWDDFVTILRTFVRIIEG